MKLFYTVQPSPSRNHPLKTTYNAIHSHMCALVRGSCTKHPLLKGNGFKPIKRKCPS